MSKKPDKILWLVSGYEPFLLKGSIRSIVGWAGKQPVVKDLSGWSIRLNRKKQYKLITSNVVHS